MAADAVWMPGRPMVGDVDKGHEVDTGYHLLWQKIIVDGGVHAWKDFQDAVTYATQYLTYYRRDDGEIHKREIVIGKVALWGNVVEHEKGYRADKAKVHAIDDILCDSEFPKHKAMTMLREFYGVDA